MQSLNLILQTSKKTYYNFLTDSFVEENKFANHQMIENFPSELENHLCVDLQNQSATMILLENNVQNQTTRNTNSKNYTAEDNFNEQNTKFSSESLQNSPEKTNTDNKNITNCLRQPSLVPLVNVETFTTEKSFIKKHKTVDHLCSQNTSRVPSSPGFLNPYKVLPPVTPSKPLHQNHDAAMEKLNVSGGNYLQNFDWASETNLVHLKPANPSKKRQLSISPLSIDEIASLFRISPTIHSIFGAAGSRRPSNDFSPLHTGVVDHSPFPSRGSSAFIGDASHHDGHISLSNHHHQSCSHHRKAGGDFLVPRPPPSLPRSRMGSAQKTPQALTQKCVHFVKGNDQIKSSAKTNKNSMAKSEDGGWVCRWIKCGIKFKVS